LLEEQEKVYNIKHRAFLFAKDIVAFRGSQHYDRIHFSIFDQLMRSGTSIGANLVEGRAGSSRKDFLNYYAIALKSSNETKYWLCLIRDTIAIDRNRTIELIQEADEISKIVGAIIVSSKRA
jgi:four helix bundle protein